MGAAATILDYRCQIDFECLEKICSKKSSSTPYSKSKLKIYQTEKPNHSPLPETIFFFSLDISRQNRLRTGIREKPRA
jgi:hypothetical protein